MGLFSFKAFLSHRYRSTEINLYFFELFKEIAEVQFEVDDKVSKVEIAVNETSVNKAVETVTIIDPNSSANSEPKSENTVRANIKKPTNVTRLERMLRDADAFIGIYPFPGSSEEAQNNTKLKEESKYFRLEIDLAIRSHKPAIIFCDKRYIDIIKPPTNILYCPFDVNDVTGPGGRLQAGKHKRFIAEFCEQVKVRKEYDILHNKGNKTVVGLMFSSHPHHQNHNRMPSIVAKGCPATVSFHADLQMYQ